VWSSY